MQVLFFVFAFLTAIALFTQAQVERFRDVRAVRLAYVQVMRQSEIDARNQRQLLLYEAVRPPKEEGEEGGSTRRVTRLNPRLNIYPLFDSRVDEADPAVQQRWDILLRLIRQVYGRSLLYQELQAQQPYLEEALLAAVMRSARALEEADRPKQGRELATLVLNDPDLQLLWYRILKGNAGSTCQDAQPPLDCFVDVRKRAKLGLSIYKARPEMLLALFQDAAVVEQLRQERLRLYREIQNKRMDTSSASESFESAYGMGRYLPDNGMWDFRVNTVKPE